MYRGTRKGLWWRWRRWKAEKIDESDNLEEGNKSQNF
jgi:hypothetical protein